MDEWQQNMKERIEKLIQELNALSSELEPAVEAKSPLLETMLLEDKLLYIYKRIANGVQKISRLLADPSFYGEYFSLIPAMSDMAMVASVIVRQTEPALALIAQGNSLQEVLGISENTIESIYKLAKYLYEQQLFEESSGAFYLLAFLNPSCETFWIGLGNSEYFLHNFKEALLAYSLAIQIDEENPHYHLLVAKCHKALGNKTAALASLGIAQLSHKTKIAGIDISKQISHLQQELLEGK